MKLLYCHPMMQHLLMKRLYHHPSIMTSPLPPTNAVRYPIITSSRDSSPGACGVGNQFFLVQWWSCFYLISSAMHHLEGRYYRDRPWDCPIYAAATMDYRKMGCLAKAKATRSRINVMEFGDQESGNHFRCVGEDLQAVWGRAHWERTSEYASPWTMHHSRQPNFDELMTWQTARKMLSYAKWSYASWD